MGESANDTHLSMEKVDGFALAASDALYVLSGRQFGGARTRTVRAPVGKSRGRTARAGLGAWWPVNVVTTVTGILRDGSALVLDTPEWAWSGGVNVTVPGRLANQRIEALINWGQDPPASGVLAATALAAELAINDPQYDGGNQTRLPGLMTSRSRQGISESFATMLDVLKEGITGIEEVDLFVLEYNQTKTRSRPRVRTMR